MIGLLIGLVVGAVGGSIGTYFFLRNNKQKAAAINSAVNTIGNAATTVGTIVSGKSASK